MAHLSSAQIALYTEQVELHRELTLSCENALELLRGYDPCYDSDARQTALPFPVQPTDRGVSRHDLVRILAR